MPERIPRVNALIKKEISQIILKEVEFPVDVLATVTRADTYSNLQESNIWISVLPEDRGEEVFKILNKNIYVLQQFLNKRLKMRPIPKIRFLKEKTTVEAAKIEEILEKLKNEEK